MPQNTPVFVNAKQTNLEAEHYLEIAKQIREEAYAQHTVQATLGGMTNAEEKETLALNKQSEVLDLIHKNYPQLFNLSASIESPNQVNEKSTIYPKQ